jgi:hypothetical protein
MFFIIGLSGEAKIFECISGAGAWVNRAGGLAWLYRWGAIGYWYSKQSKRGK